MEGFGLVSSKVTTSPFLSKAFKVGLTGGATGEGEKTGGDCIAKAFGEA